MDKNFNFSQITFTKLYNEIKLYIRSVYNKSDSVLSPASPYGQILTVVVRLFTLSMNYLKATINMYSITETNKTNKKITRSSAVLAGHNPTRAISATGTIRLKLKSGANLISDVRGKKVIIYNKTRLRNKTNGLEYIIDLGGVDKKVLYVNENGNYIFNIIQGRWVNDETFTSDGSEYQTFVVNPPANSKEIENNNVFVYVNDELWEQKAHIYDMLLNEKAVVINTAFEGGIQLTFGGSGYGLVPNIGSIINVRYIQSDGSDGNIFRKTTNDFEFIDDIYDGYNNSINVSDTFDTYINTNIDYGTDGESIEFTNAIMPYVSKNFVLAEPSQYMYAIKKLGVFSYVNAYLKNDKVFITATPNVNLFKNKNSDYFTVDKSAFTLDRREIEKIDLYLKSSGNIRLTYKYEITSPSLSYYVLNVFYILYDDVKDDEVNDKIKDIVSEYMLNLGDMSRIPKINILKKIGELTEVASVDISFTCKKNEDYHRNIIEINRQKNDASIGSGLTNTTEVYTVDQTVVGLDPILGDIVFEANEIPIIRGGWYDRYGVYYDDSLDSGGLKSINFIKKGIVPRK